MSNAVPSSYTSDFVREFEVETTRLLRERFLYFCGLTAGLTQLFMVGLVVLRFFRDSATDRVPGTLGSLWNSAGTFAAQLLFAQVPTLIFAAGFVAAYRGKIADRDLIRLTSTLTVAVGLFHFIAAHLPLSPTLGLPLALLTFTLAAVFLPWTARQSLHVAAVLLLIYAAALLFFRFVWIRDAEVARESTPDRLLEIFIRTALAACLAVPGCLIAWAKHSRRTQQFKFAFIQRRYVEVRRELTDARRIHEDLFPRPVLTGPVTFNYIYEPMRQIGGDYLYAKLAGISPTTGLHARLSLVVMDVTGHGIPAALTVNRLHGELERLFAEHPNIAPGNVLKLLNRYVHLTLANHSVYVTALCLRVDCARNQIEYASGGHPPAFLRGIDGTLRELPSTAFVLGACPDEDFHPDPAVQPFGPGDALIAYTDGAIEARDRSGRMLGLQGFLRMLASLSQSSSPHTVDWTSAILRTLEHYRFGPPADDTLIIQVARPLHPGGGVDMFSSSTRSVPVASS